MLWAGYIVLISLDDDVAVVGRQVLAHSMYLQLWVDHATHPASLRSILQG